MADLNSLNEILSVAANILDTAASEVRDIPLNPLKDNIYKIGKVLTIIHDLQDQICKIDPKFEPEYLRRPSPFPPEINRRFGKILIKATDLCDEKKYKEAISLYKSYILENPPEFFKKMAELRIEMIEKGCSV